MNRLGFAAVAVMCCLLTGCWTYHEVRNDTLVISPDGKTIACLQRMEAVHTRGGHIERVVGEWLDVRWAPTFDPSNVRTIRVADEAETYHRFDELGGHRVGAMRFSPDGRHVAVYVPSGLCTVELATGEVRKLTDASALPDGLAWLSSDEIVYWTETRTPGRRLSVNRQKIDAPFEERRTVFESVGRNPRNIASASPGGRWFTTLHPTTDPDPETPLRFIAVDVLTGRTIDLAPPDEGVIGVAWKSDERTAAVLTQPATDRIRAVVMDLDAGRILVDFSEAMTNAFRRSSRDTRGLSYRYVTMESVGRSWRMNDRRIIVGESYLGTNWWLVRPEPFKSTTLEPSWKPYDGLGGPAGSWFVRGYIGTWTAMDPLSGIEVTLAEDAAGLVASPDMTFFVTLDYDGTLSVHGLTLPDLGRPTPPNAR